MENIININLVDIINNMSVTDIKILDFLNETDRFNGITANDLLEEDLAISKTTLCKVLSKLEFINAIHEKTDGKIKYYYIAPIGLKILEYLNNN